MLRIGIIGSGFGLYGLLPAFNAIPGCKVVCMCGKKTDRLVAYCNSIGLENLYTDWKKMLEREKLDAVAIAVTPNAQYAIAKAAIKKGLHIFAEKPLAARYAQAKELARLAQKKGIVHAVDFIFPEISEWKKTKEILDNEVLGTLRHVSLNWDFQSHDIKNKIASWKTNSAEGGGAAAFYFSHSLHYLEMYAGNIRSLKSLFSYSKRSLNGGEAGVDVLLKFANGVTGYAHMHCNAPGMMRHQLIFTCEKGSIILENKGSVTENFTIALLTEGSNKKVVVKKERHIPKIQDQRVSAVKKIALRFVTACRNGKQMIPSFREGVRVQQLIDQIKAEQIKVQANI